MSIYAEIVAGVVTNVIVCNDPTLIASNWQEIDQLSPQPGIGWTVNGSAWTPPAIPVSLTNLEQLQANALTALANNITFLGLAAPTFPLTSGEQQALVAQVAALTRQVDAIIRMLVGALDVTAGT